MEDPSQLDIDTAELIMGWRQAHIYDIYPEFKDRWEDDDECFKIVWEKTREDGSKYGSTTVKWEIGPDGCHEGWVPTQWDEDCNQLIEKMKELGYLFTLTEQPSGYRYAAFIGEAYSDGAMNMGNFSSFNKSRREVICQAAVNAIRSSNG
jgi:hypothetical protein